MAQEGFIERKLPEKKLGLEAFKPSGEKRINLQRSDKTKEGDFEILRSAN